MSYPSWITSSNLGTFSEDYSFSLSPIVITFSASSDSIITLLNGGLPDGLSWTLSGNSILITGIADPTLTIQNSRITYRITQSTGEIADRTFFLTLTPISIPPSWAGQETFLGFQSNVQPETYQLVATAPPGQHITYGISSPGTTGNVNVLTTINSVTGLLLCDASNVTTNSTVTIGVSATAGLTSNITLFVDIVTTDTGPLWVTPAGSLGNFSSGDFINIQLEAEDPIAEVVTYSLFSNPDDLPISVSSDGILFGRAPTVISTTDYTFTVAASNGVGTAYQTFSITVAINTATSLLAWVTKPDLGSFDEGQFITIPLEAVTVRGTLIDYYFTGGILPPHLIIRGNNITGYCEYTPITKTYYFDIAASDNTQIVTQQFSLTVNKIYEDQFFSAKLPITGQLKEQVNSSIANVRVREPTTNKYNSISNSLQDFSVNLIDGVIITDVSPDEFINQSSNWLHELTLQIGNTSVANSTSNTSILYTNIVDSQAGANSSVFSSAVFNTNVLTNGIVYPISIKNIRDSILEGHALVGSGSGNGCILSPVLNFSTGSITSVDIINPGQNYIAPPNITVNGSGTGAEVKAVLGVIDVDVLDQGQGWSVGDRFSIDIGNYTESSNVTVTNTGINGSLVSIDIDTPGNYTQIPSITSVNVTNGVSNATILPNWGVSSVIIKNGGKDYQDSINMVVGGREILPSWQKEYSPIINIGTISSNVSNLAANVMNVGNNTVNGTLWQPLQVIFQWQGLKWLGSTSYDNGLTTFDGGITGFEEVETPVTTEFDKGNTTFDISTTFDAVNPFSNTVYDLWGKDDSNVFDDGATLFDVGNLIVESKTLVSKIITVNNRIYSGNNVSF